MSANNALIFEPVRRWLDDESYTKARIAALDSALARFLAAPTGPDRNKIVFETIRGWLDARAYGPDRIAQLDAALADYARAVPSGPGLVGVAANILIPAASPVLSSGFADQAAEDRFFAAVRESGLFPRGLNDSQVAGIKAKCSAFAMARYSVGYVSDAMETSHHETGAKMQPVEEIGKGRGKPYGRPGRYGGQIPYGRGDVQLTWDDNYQRGDVDLRLNGELTANFALALRPDISARIMVSGMSKGWFTGKRLGSYLPASGPGTYDQFFKCRQIINRLDRAALLANNALKWQACFQAGGWR